MGKKWSDGAKLLLQMKRSMIRNGVAADVIEKVLKQNKANGRAGILAVEVVITRAMCDRIRNAVAEDGYCAVYRSKRGGRLMIIRKPNVDVRFGGATHVRNI